MNNMNEPGYESLAKVLQEAYDQAARGKGAERHANDLPFDQQPMQQIARRRGLGFLLGQVDKKTEEAQGMLERGDRAAWRREILGAINYLAGALVFTSEPSARDWQDWRQVGRKIPEPGRRLVVRLATGATVMVTSAGADTLWPITAQGWNYADESGPIEPSESDSPKWNSETHVPEFGRPVIVMYPSGNVWSGEWRHGCDVSPGIRWRYVD